ncbi:hypothetical protein ABOM_001667 [Aspergillus bombycis]|uniref:Uncharacterized protein n=1 Tax=Aspergillus bombycis TaxID=109264 RepID=A0A1F8ADW3_9EURO|nr:hypothetical protein ABOM_001667 [Aspergillus bombycis]OGM49548.1 hypothetical protein ABOM_001667 [Aspergillus bombycis]
MSPNNSYKTSEGFNTALGAGLNSTWSGADAVHGVVNAGVRIEGAVAEHQWTKARVNEQLQRAQYPDGKPRLIIRRSTRLQTLYVFALPAVS